MMGFKLREVLSPFRSCTALHKSLVVLLLFSYYLRWLDSVISRLPVPQPEAGWVPAPPWLAPALKALTRRRLTDEERELFRRDGAIAIRGVINDERVLQLLSTTVGWEKNKPHQKWWWHGVMHALVRHSPLPELAASALDVPEVTIWNSQVEPRPGKAERKEPMPAKPWLDTRYGVPTDMSVHEDTDSYYGHLHRASHFTKPMASFFLAVSDLPRGLELLAGSHVANQRHQCARRKEWLGQGVFADCMERLEKDCLGFRSWDLAPGDVLLFYGSLFHWTILQEKPRLALSVRYVPADMPYTGWVEAPHLVSYTNWNCGPIGGSAAFPILYSNNSSRISQEVWPLWPKNKDYDVAFLLLRFLLWALDPRCRMIYDF